MHDKELRMLTRRSLSLLGLSGVAALVGFRPALAEGAANLNISPHRIVFDPNTRVSTVLVFNTGDAPASYNIELIDRVMAADGSLISLADAQKAPALADAVARLKTAREMVTFTPRRVVLAPGESQTIRIRVLRPDGLAPGDYRTHLTVTAVPPQDQGLTADQAAAQSDGSISVRLTALFAISIPLVVRQGPADVAAALENVRYRPAAGAAAPAGTLSLEIARKGASSLYGDIAVRSAKDGPRGKPLGALGGLGVYAEIDRRSVQVPLSRPLTPGEIVTITYTDEDSKVGQIIAGTSYKVG
ncbi:hypothetical protein ACO2Q3_00570 [Caulobacter sp. KR2-114]|uniref:hypothetical protein n=1 Tax=Caulobacter sp. KR2-114 TaxID=3400912 RepID=UPI003C011AEC